MSVGSSPNRAVPLCILAIDIAGFSRTNWLDPTLAQVRADLDDLVQPVLETVAVDAEGTSYSNTGDGMLCLVDATHRGDVIDAVVALEQRLGEYNQARGRQERLRLRVVIHFGDVIRDGGNEVGDALNFAFRLLDSARLRARLASAQRDLVLMVSEDIYPVIARGNCSKFAASDFEQVAVRNKKLRAKAWVFRRQPRPAGFRGGLAAVWERAWEIIARLGGPIVRVLRRRVWHVPLWAPLALLLVLALVIGVIVVVNRSATDVCPIPTELPVLTSPTNEALVRQLGDMFTDNLKGLGGRCRQGNVTVFSVPSSSDISDAVATGWSIDSVTRYGPEPSVLILDSSAEVNRIDERLPGTELSQLGSVASSPVVLAMRQSDRERVGLGRASTWNGIRRAGQPAGNPTVRIVRSDPTSTATALLGTAELYSISQDASDRREIEQMLTPVVSDSEAAALCPQGHDRPLVGGGGPPTAVIISEQLMVARNLGKLGGSCAGQPPAESDPLEAIYPSDRTPFLDYPYVLLKAAFKDGREEIARKFFQFLASDPDARSVLCEHGFRNTSRQVCGTISERDGVLAATPVTPVPALSGKEVRERLDQWAAARRAAWALLVLDVSGSMRNQLPDQPGADRMAAARGAARNAVQLMGSRDHIGLWKFSTRLEGDRDYQELVPLGPVERQRQVVLDALSDMRATKGDTGLYDTIIAGVTHLQDKGGGDNDANALIVVTDGENDDRTGGATIRDVIDQLPDERQMHVFLLVFGPAACGSPSLTMLTNRTDAVCLDAGEIGLEPAFKQVSATLWGTE